MFSFSNMIAWYYILQGTFLLNQALSRALVSASVQNASIVNISSIVGKVCTISRNT